MPVARLSHHLVENGIFPKINAQMTQMNCWFQLPLTIYTPAQTAYSVMSDMCLLFFSESPTTSKHFMAIIGSEFSSDRPELVADGLVLDQFVYR